MIAAEGPQRFPNGVYGGVRPAAVLHYIGLIILLVGAFMVLPLLVSLIYREGDTPALLVSTAVTLVAGGSLWLATRSRERTLLRKESFVVVGLGWLLVSVFGALPYILGGTFTSYVDAYFEAISGFTTTGASVLADIEAQPHGILFWRNLTQWIGGMGIIALFVALLPLTRIGAAGVSALIEDEAPTPRVDRLTPRIRGTAQVLWGTYLLLTVLLIGLLMILGMNPFDAITHSFTTLATGGYSPRNTSIAYFDSAAVDWVLVVFMVLAGVNFNLYFLLWSRRRLSILNDPELKAYLAILLGVTVLVAVDLMVTARYSSPDEALRFAAFQVTSLQTTTGYATADYDTWSWFSKLLLLMVMVIGASAGSTGGGMKVIRVLVVGGFARRQLLGVLRPREVIPLKLGARVVPDDIVRESVGFLIVLLAVITLSTLALVALELDAVTAFSGVLATVNVVGPALGLLGPTLNYSALPDLAKLVYIFDMWVGRLELWTVLILLAPRFWREQ